MADTFKLKSEFSVGAEVGDKKYEIQSEQTLVEASSVGNSEKVTELLRSGVLVDADGYNQFLFYASQNYMTPLQLASANGHIECVKILIAYGADVDAKDCFDVTALHMAAEKGHFLCLKALLDANADCYSSTKFSKSGCYGAVPHPGGTTPLHVAAANNRVDCVKELIQYGADYNATDEHGHTSLFIAAFLGFRECVLTHLKNAVGRDILSLPDFVTGDTPLHLAVSHKMVDCVRELLYLGSDVNHINTVGYSPLHIALTNVGNKANDMEILKLLVLEGYNTDINLEDAVGYSPLHYVCFSGPNQRRPEMAKFLISHGADVNIKNIRGISLLHCELSSSENDYEILKFVVNSMLQLPSKRDINPFAEIESRSRVTAANRDQTSRFLNYRTPPPNILSRMHNLYPNNDQEEINYHLDLNTGVHQDLSLVRQQDLDYIFDNHEDDSMSVNDEVNVEEVSWNSVVLEKKLWYDQISSNPRTLKHCCRYVIRQTLGSHRLKYVRKLPLPAAIKSYILLDCND